MENKSKKDIAFDKERQKYKKKIRELESETAQLKENAQQRERELVEQNDALQEKILEQNEWIDRLLEYTELSREDLITILNNEKEKAKMYERVAPVLDVTHHLCEKYGF